MWKCSLMLNHQIKGVKPNTNTPEIVFTSINDAENEYGWNSAEPFLNALCWLQLFTGDPWAAANIAVYFGEPEPFYLC